MKKLVLAAVIITVPAFAFGAAGVTSVFDIGIGVRAQSMGGAYAAAADDSASAYFNPSGLDTLDRVEIHGAYIPLFLDASFNYLTFGIPTVDFGCIGFSFALINTEGITFRDSIGNEISDESQNLVEIIAGWGRSFFDDRLSMGFNIKLDNHSMASYNDLGFGMDMGFLYRVIDTNAQKLNAGIVLENLIEPRFKLSDTTDKLPRQYEAGLSYNRVLSPDMEITGNLDFSFSFDADFEYKAGIELGMFGIFDIRTGYNSYGFFSLGAGLFIADFAAIDYGLVFTGLDTQNRLSLKFRFGPSVSDLRANREKNRRKEIEKQARLLATKELSSLREKIDKLTGEAKKEERFKAFHYSKALESYFDGDLKRALLEFETVYKADDKYMNAQYYISLIKSMSKQVVEGLYSDEILALYRAGVDRYLREDYKGAKEEWERILKIDQYNKLAIENLREVNRLIRDLENIGGE